MEQIFFFIIGLIFGSFFNVCIYRLPGKESVINPPSHCPSCGHKLGIVDLIPVVSYFIRRGKCAYCGQPISWRYPLVELLTGVLFAAVGPSIFNLVFISLLIIVFFVDLEHLVIPDLISYSGIALGLVYNLSRGEFASAVIGCLLGFGALFLVAKFGKLIYKKEAMGAGDWFLGAMIGACLGWQQLVLVLFLAYVLAAAAALLLLGLKKVKTRDMIPFGPALALAALISLFFGRQIIGWYAGLPL